MFPGRPHPGYVRKSKREKEKDRERQRKEKSQVHSLPQATVSKASLFEAFLLKDCTRLELTKPSRLA